MKYTMSKQELEKYRLIRGAVEGRYTVKAVSQRLKLSERRVKQLKRSFREVGEEALIHGNSGRHPANYTREDLRRQIITLKQSGAYERA
jgi:transposase